jgi:ankyrin repeat protein
MSELPVRPDLDQLRRQAKELLRAARAGDKGAATRIEAVKPTATLAAAQLAIAREHGFASWAKLKAEIEQHTRQAEVFAQASIRDWTGRAAEMLAANPELAGYSIATAVVLGDVARTKAAIARDPSLVTRADARSGFTALHAACASRWHRLDPKRADGLLAVARLLLDAGADPGARAGNKPDGWTPLRCAVAGAANPAIVRLLLDRGAVPDDHDVYLACFGEDDNESLRVLLEAGANPDALDPDGLSLYRWAISQGRDDLAALLRDHGARDDTTSAERFLAACARADTDGVHSYLQNQPNLITELSTAEMGTALMRAAEDGNTAAIKLMLDLGFLVDARGDHGGTALHSAASAGSTSAVRFLLDQGADLEARDTSWDSTPLIWAMVGSGERIGRAPDADWVATVQVLLDAGADTNDVTLSPDDPKAPSPEVAQLLRDNAIGGDQWTSR